MTMNTTGAIALGGPNTGQSINLEISASANAPTSLNATSVRALAQVPSGAITMPTNFYGKSSGGGNLTYVVSANTTNLTINLSQIPGYVAGSSSVTITINSGVYVYATSTSNAGLTIVGGVAGDTLTLVNNGYILGMGGAGSSDNASAVYIPPTAGGPALSLGYTTTINNINGWIAGGGGGGAGGILVGGGGGAGGGPGADADGGGPGQYGTSGTLSSGGGGGRVLPGSGGAGGAYTTAFNTTNSGAGGGAGGGGAATGPLDQFVAIGYGQGGAGGSANGAGGNGSFGSGGIQTGGGAGGGGGWGAPGGSGGDSFTATSGGAGGGNAVQLNGNQVTWVNGNTSQVLGAVS